MHRPGDDTGALKEAGLRLVQAGLIEAELGPIRELAVPEHDR